MAVRYPDISQYQRGINVATLPGPILVARCWRGNVNAADTHWSTFRDAAIRLGKVPVAYIYIGTTKPPAHQAEMLARTIGDRNIPVMVDWEEGGGSILNLRNTVAEIQKRGMRVVMTYVPRWYWQKAGRPSLAGLPALVNSHYHDPHNPAAWEPFGGLGVTILQYTDRELQGGQRIDMNLFRGSEAELLRLIGADSVAGPLRPTLRLGDTGPAVRDLQSLLNEHGA